MDPEHLAKLRGSRFDRVPGSLEDLREVGILLVTLKLKVGQDYVVLRKQVVSWHCSF